jgi:hypothetical protein
MFLRIQRMLLLVCLGALLAPQGAAAATHITSTTLNTNTTWSLPNSPYIIDGNVSVASGVTLTIDPGVIVKFNGSTRWLNVNGTLHAVGTPLNRITFTSIQDDSVGGDDGNDGPTQGAPGQWFEIKISGSHRTSVLAYTDIRYGGWGSGNTAYGAVHTSGSGSVQISNALITFNQRSGVLISGGTSATISSSESALNGNGISTTGFLSLRANSNVHHNSQDGLWFNYVSTYDGPASTIMHSNISNNGRFGVNLGAQSDVPSWLMPHGNYNNIFANPSGGLVYGQRRFDVDWKNNFWGSDVYFYTNSSSCSGVQYDSLGKLAFTGGTGNPPAGPISGGWYLVGTSTRCAYDNFRIYPGEFSFDYIVNTSEEYGSGFHTEWYSFANASCEAKSDPISMVFYGNGSALQTLNHVQYHSGWGIPTFDDPQYFQSGTTCRDFDVSLANPAEPPLVDRDHVRITQTQSEDSVLGVTSVATPHRDTWHDECLTHVINFGGPGTGLPGGFVEGREALETAIGGSNHHPWYEEYVGNTYPLLQTCTGWTAASDGYVDYVYIPDTIIHPAP